MAMHTELTTNTAHGQQPAHGVPLPIAMREAVARIKGLPTLPAIAQRIMQVAADPLADAAKLAETIELDPLLTAQIIRWAGSPLYAYRGKIVSVKDAIIRVLGFDFVLNAALSLAALKPLQISRDGALGSQALWLQALASARLMQLLNNLQPVDQKLPGQEIFAAALIHNIGFQLLGHAFHEEYDYLNKIVSTNVSLSVVSIEQFALDVDHGLLGAWLMRTWAMPKPLIDVVYHHHNPYYRGDNYRLNLITFVNDCLLGELGLGDAQHVDCPDEVYTDLQLAKTDCLNALDAISAQLDSIKQTAELLTAAV
ncbi:MAG: histidine kinase [Methylobacter sp.]|nr:MAG: histidine kinase [Methylobacter sp.]